MNATEKLIRDAFVRQAERAPDREMILAGLRAPGPTRAAPQWPRRGALTLAATGVIAAVTVPVVLFTGDDNAAGPATGTECQPAEPVVDGRRQFLVGYSPTWVPDGLAPFGLLLGVLPATDDLAGYDRTQRSWNGPSGIMTFQWRQTAEPLPAGTPVDINGHEAIVEERNQMGRLRVVWRPAPDQLFVVGLLSNPGPQGRPLLGTDDLLRTARSVGPDCRIVPSIGDFGWLPDNVWLTEEQAQVNEASGWESHVIARDPTAGRDRGMIATVHATEPEADPSAEPIEVRGTTGRYFEHVEGGVLQVELDDGRWLEVYGFGWEGIDQQAIVRAAEELVIWPTPDYDWLGR